MSSYLKQPLTPRDGLMLYTLVIARISTEHQDKQSLDDQIAKIREFMSQVYSRPIEWRIIKSQGSGEHLDRKEFSKLRISLRAASTIW